MPLSLVDLEIGSEIVRLTKRLFYGLCDCPQTCLVYPVVELPAAGACEDGFIDFSFDG
jgi:hypothetical protein